MQISLRPFDDMLSLSVFRQLDPHDYIEAELVRGRVTNAVALWADWRGAEGYRIRSYVAMQGQTPFAVFGLSHTGQAGVAAGALLARDHAHFRRSLGKIGLIIRNQMPGLLHQAGIHRVEARSWAGHPTAGGLLHAIGFRHECDMPGFGQTGKTTFRQWAYLTADHIDFARSETAACAIIEREDS